MRRITILVAIALVWMLVLPAMAQDGPGPITRVTQWVLDPDADGDKFEEGLKKHNQFHAKQGDTQGHFTWEIVSGPNSGKLYRTAPARHWADFDAEAEWGDADAADSVKNLDPYIAFGTTAYWVRRGDVSRPPATQPSAMASLVFFKIKIGRVAKADRLIKKFHEAIGETEWPSNYIWFQLVNGLEGPLFALVLPRDNWADMAPPEKAFDAMLEEAYGEPEAEALLEEWGNTIQSMTSEIIRLRRDLSYVPSGS